MNTHPRNYAPLGWVVRDRVEAEYRAPTKREGIEYLTVDAPHAACFSLYGRTSIECAPVAWRLAYLIARDTGEPITFDSLDHCMGLVVNDHEAVAYTIRNYGHGMYR
jgi:hypothetical protein